MVRKLMAGVLVALVVGPVSAQAPVGARLRWQPGQVLLYKSEHSTFASDSVGDNKSETRSLVKVTRRWQVLAVDAAGVATLQMSLVALAQERTTPKGEVLRYDSADPDKSSPELKGAFSKFLNVPLAVLRVDGLGRLVEVKESKFGPASSYENQLPFVGVLPAEGLRTGASWQRDFLITLAPPLGTGEKHPAVQRFTCKSVTADRAVVAFTTELKTAPATPADAVPLWQVLPAGELVYDLRAGRLQSATLTIDKEVKGHQGENSACKFRSSDKVEYVGR